MYQSVLVWCVYVLIGVQVTRICHFLLNLLVFGLILDSPSLLRGAIASQLTLRCLWDDGYVGVGTQYGAGVQD